MTTGRLYLPKINKLYRAEKQMNIILFVVFVADKTPPAHGFHLHARESKSTVSLHADYPSAFVAFAPLKSRSCYCETEAHSHRSERTSVQPAGTRWILDSVTASHGFFLNRNIP